MKIYNHTNYRLSHLRAFCQRIGKYQLEPDQLRNLRIHINYRRDGSRMEPNKELDIHPEPYGARSCSGKAFLNSSLMYVNVPASLIDRIDLAMVIAHEMAHTRGMTHNQMRGHPQYRRVGVYRQFYSWAESMPLEKYLEKMKADPVQKIIPEPKPKKPIQVVRFEKISEQVKKWESKFKRAENALKKLRPKLSYYEKALARKKNSIAIEK